MDQEIPRTEGEDRRTAGQRSMGEQLDGNRRGRSLDPVTIFVRPLSL